LNAKPVRLAKHIVVGSNKLLVLEARRYRMELQDLRIALVLKQLGPELVIEKPVLLEDPDRVVSPTIVAVSLRGVCSVPLSFRREVMRSQCFALTSSVVLYESRPPPAVRLPLGMKGHPAGW
jgi:hypothetical protein